MKKWGKKRWKWKRLEEGPEGGFNLAGGSGISLQRSHRHKHTNTHRWLTAAFKMWSVGEYYSTATGRNTHYPREVFDNTAH